MGAHLIKGLFVKPCQVIIIWLGIILHLASIFQMCRDRIRSGKAESRRIVRIM